MKGSDFEIELWLEQELKKTETERRTVWGRMLAKPESPEMRRLEFEESELEKIVSGLRALVQRQRRERKAEWVDAEIPPRDTCGRFLPGD